MESVDLHSL